MYLTKVIGAALSVSASSTFNLTALTQAAGADPLTADDIDLAFNEVASCVVADITITVVP